MGGVWCKTDKGQSRPYSPRGPFNTTISRWTDHVRQAYRKQKPHHRPPRPPQKPARSNERLTISAPTLVTEASSDGWKTATLIVPDVQEAPVPPPRKKRKRNRDLTRSAVSMDDLNRGSSESLTKSTISLPDKCHSDIPDYRSSSSTLIVTPMLESRVSHHKNNADEDDKENVKTTVDSKIEEEDENEIDTTDQPEIIPIEKKTLFSSRILLHSNLGYIDKLSAISEVSAESGFDDKTDILKSSEGSGSVTSVDSVPKETGLNILAHIHNINNVSQLKDNADIREKTAVSKKEWLQNILQEDPEPYIISKDASRAHRRGSEDVIPSTGCELTCAQPNSLPTNHLHLMNRETQTLVADDVVSETTSSTPQNIPPYSNDSNHSILLDIIQNNKETENETTMLNFSHKDHKEESIFLKNTKTNIIYKSLSSDKLTDDYDINYSDVTEQKMRCNSDNRLNSISKGGHQSLDATNSFNDLTSKTHLSDYSFQTPKLVESDSGLNSLMEDKRHNIVTSFDFKEISKSHNYVTVPQNLQLLESKVPSGVDKNVLLNGVEKSIQKECDTDKNVNESKRNDKLISKDALAKKDSVPSSRRSSITDSLHEFEMSIYDMLKESKKNENSSDEEDSLKTVK